MRSLRARSHLLLVGGLLAGAFLIRLPGIAEPSIEQRETQSALLARQWYIGDDSGLPSWKQSVLRELSTAVKPIEPPVLELLAVAHFRLAGENFWFPRLISSLLWVVGGVFLYLIATRITTREGAFVSLALYLAWPFAVWLSRHFMPDAMMVAFLLAAVLTVIRYWEQPSPARLVTAGVVSSLATAVKPGVAFLYLVALFTVIAISRRELGDALWGGRLPLFVAIAATPSAIYYFYGTYFSDFIWSGADAGRVTPESVVNGWFWTDWWDAVSYLLRFPQTQAFLALVPLAAGLAGLALAPRGMPRALLVGLSLGYLAFALTVADYTSGNPYYSLPLIPILSLSIGVVAGHMLERVRTFAPSARRALLGFIILVIGVAVFKSYVILTARETHQVINDYRRIGELTGHTTRAIVVDRELSTPVMYWGWIVGESWELTYAYPPPWIHPEQADFLIVVGIGQLETSRGLRDFARGLPVVARTERYAIFNLR